MANHRKTTPQFVEEAQRVHGEKFDYSEVEYANTHTPVRIKCRQCGVVFMQEPASHLAGSGCPKCSKNTDRKMSQEAFYCKGKGVAWRHSFPYSYHQRVASLRA